MRDKPEPLEPIVVTTVFDDEGGVEKYKGVAVDQLLGGSIEETVWLLWTGEKPTKLQAEVVKMIVIIIADHGPAVAGAYATVLASSAGLELPQAVAAGIQMIGPRFGGASGAAAKQFKDAVENKETVDQFVNRLKQEGTVYIPGIGHKVFSKSKPDKRVKELVEFVLARHSGEEQSDDPRIRSDQTDSGRASLARMTKHLDFALNLEEELLKKNEKLILNIDGAIGAILLDFGFPIEGIDGFFVLARTIGLVAHYIDQKQRGTGLIRLPEELVLYKSDHGVNQSKNQ